MYVFIYLIWNVNKNYNYYSKINIDKGYLPSSIYVDRGGNIELLNFDLTWQMVPIIIWISQY
jgi:hypothetical protein